ncbi:MAG: hypothetical protein DDT18_00054 [Actinobacteria bacterium]|nr:hypothetical protein [Actinomycetota bacterium]
MEPEVLNANQVVRALQRLDQILYQTLHIATERKSVYALTRVRGWR